MRIVFIFFFLGFININNFSFAQGIWVQKANIAVSRAGTVAFSIGSKGYFGTGWQFSANIYNDFWEWDKATDTWTQKANFSGLARGDASGFSIGNKGYIGTGSDGSQIDDFWEWNQATNVWTLKSNFSGGDRMQSIGFSIGNKGYIGIGEYGSARDDFWQFDPTTNLWTQKANFGGGNRRAAVGFAIGNYGYIGTGYDNFSCMNDFWEYNPSLNIWIQKANFPGSVRMFASGFSINNKGYIGTGIDCTGNLFDDFYEWDQAANTWTQKANYSHPVCDIDRGSFAIGCNGYFIGGAAQAGNGGVFYNDFWEYTPDNLPSVPATINPNSTICLGDNVTLFAGGGTNYSWNTGSTINSIIISPTATTTYSVTVSTDCGSKTVSTTVFVISSSNASFSYKYDPCKNNCLQFVDASVNVFSWCWNMGDGGTSPNQNPCWQYPVTATYNPSLIVNCNTACADTFSVFIPYEIHDTASVLYVPNAFSPNGDGENDVLRFYIQDDYCVKEFEITIYDRWGEKVYETTNLSDSWDGSFNGKKLHSDMFVYYCKTISATGIITTRKGNINLLW